MQVQSLVHEKQSGELRPTLRAETRGAGSEKEQSTSSASIPLSLKISLLSIALAAIPLVIVAPLILRYTADRIEGINREWQIAMASNLAHVIEDHMRRSISDLQTLGLALVDPSVDDSGALSLAAKLLEGSGTLDRVSVYDVTGSYIDTIHTQKPLRKEPTQLGQKQMDKANAEGVFVDEVMRSPSGPRVLLVAPLGSASRAGGYVASLVSLAPIQSAIGEMAGTHLEERGEVTNRLLVVDNKLRAFAHSNPEESHRLSSVDGHKALRSVRSRLVAGQRIPPMSMEYDEGKVAMVGTVLGVVDYGWAVLVQLPQSIAYRTVTVVQRYVMVTVVLAVLIALVVAFWSTRQITKPLGKLVAFANDLAKRRFNNQVEVSTRDELATLGNAMNSAAADLAHSDTRIREEVSIRTDLGRYLPGELVSRIVRRKQELSLGGEHAEITVMFADVVAFTPLTDRLEPEETVSILNDLFTIVTEIVFRHGGTVDKFIGDSVMAIWGAPNPNKSHAQHALEAADEILRWLEVGNDGWKERYGVTLELAIGVHSGKAIVGNIGSRTRMVYTAIGDVVNVAARLESIARPNQILTTLETRDASDGSLQFFDRGVRELPGRFAPLHLFEVRGV